VHPAIVPFNTLIEWVIVATYLLGDLVNRGLDIACSCFIAATGIVLLFNSSFLQIVNELLLAVLAEILQLRVFLRHFLELSQ